MSVPVKKKYRALTGLNIVTSKGERRIEAGQIIKDLPPRSALWLLEQKLIELVKGG